MSFYQTSVVKKYLAGQDEAQMKAAYEKYTSHFHDHDMQEELRSMKEEEYQDGFLVDLFVNIFDYTKRPNPKGYDLIREKKNETDGKKADGAILKEGDVLAVIELKGSSTTDLDKITSQAFGYKNNQSNCLYVITSNFEKLRFYIRDIIHLAEFNLFTLSYEQFQLLWLFLQKDNLLHGIPLKVREESLHEEEKVTKRLYNDYSAFKSELWRNMVQGNPGVSELLLYEKSQKLLDRFLFVFFSEDKGLLPPNFIDTIIQEWETLKELDAYCPLYEIFKKYFGYMDIGVKRDQFEIHAYNGGLFRSDKLLDGLHIDDEVLRKHCRILTKYDFITEVDTDILGHIFEHSLNDIENVRAELAGVKVEKSKTKRKKDGVFYTPKYITKYIIDNTVGILCEEKKRELGIDEEEFAKDRKGRRKVTLKKLASKLNEYRDWLLKITICDPACGSGAFLNQALEFLIAEHSNLDELETKLLGTTLVFQGVESHILENNIFGVDINDESVEIAKLSLWLRTAKPGRKLTSLSNNIKCGNSLIDDKEVAGEKAFNWEQRFPKVFKNGGFDVVIGNPPYVRSRDEVLDNFKEYYYSKFTCIHEKPNLYLLFMEKSLSLVRKKGLFSFVVPNSWLGMESGKKIRELLLQESTINYLVGLEGDSFTGVGVETVIFVITKSKPGNHITQYSMTSGQDVLLPRLSAIEQNVWLSNRNHLIDIKSSDSEGEVIKSIKAAPYLVGNIYEVRVGMQAYEKGKGYLPQSEDDVKNHIFDYDSKYDEDTHPYLQGRDIVRYGIKWSGSWLRWGPWLSQPKQFDQFSKPRVLIREITGKFPQVLISTYTEEIYLNNKSIINVLEISDNNSLKALVAILNSKLIAFYHVRQAVKGNRSLFPKAVVKDVKNYPFPSISQQVKVSLESYVERLQELTNELFNSEDAFVQLIQAKYSLDYPSKKMKNWKSLDFKELLGDFKKSKVNLSLEEEDKLLTYFNKKKPEVNALQSKIALLEKKINQLVYKIYGLNSEQIEIIENS